MKTIHIALLFLVACSLITPIVYGEDQYIHVLTIESPTPSNSAWFGVRVKISGDKIIVNEPYANAGEVLEAGKVYVYYIDGTLLTTIQSPTPENLDNFGYLINVYEDTIAIKDRFGNVDNLNNAGEAHIFTTNGTHQLTLQSPEPKDGGYFGTSGIHENIIVVSESSKEGTVYLFDRQGTYLKTLISPNPIASGDFGREIEVSETLILIGEYGSSSLPRGPGSVYVFNHAGEHLMTLQAPMPEERARFGTSISTSEDLIVIGESYATADDVWRAGRVYIFDIEGDLLQTLQSPTLKSGGEFGCHVAIDGDIVVVGERFANVNPFQYEGRAYVFNVDGTLLQNLTAPVPCPRATFGNCVDIDGDFIVVGEPWAATEELGQAGLVQVYKLGAPVEAQEPVEETTTETEETESEKESNGGIPGFPVLAILAALVIYYLNRKWLLLG